LRYPTDTAKKGGVKPSGIISTGIRTYATTPSTNSATRHMVTDTGRNTEIRGKSEDLGCMVNSVASGFKTRPSVWMGFLTRL